MVDYSKFLDGVDDVKETYGFSNDPLPKGQYPFTVVEIQERGETQTGVPYAKAQLAVMEGPYKNRRIFETIYFGASETKGVQDGDQFVRVARTEEEYEKASKSAVGRAKGWTKALGLGYGPKDDVYAYYNVNAWTGCQVMCELGIRNDQNNVTGFCSVDDPKKGLSNWREKVLPMQLKKVGGGATTPVATL